MNAAILGAPAPFNFLGLSFPTRENPKPAANAEIAAKNTAAVQCPILIFAGTADQLLPLDRELYERLEKASKNVTLEIYQDGYHDFVMGPQGHAGRNEPLMGATLDALDRAVRFTRNPAEYR